MEVLHGMKSYSNTPTFVVGAFRVFFLQLVKTQAIQEVGKLLGI